MRRFWRDNGLTLVLIGLFLASFLAMALSGWKAHNAELADMGLGPLSLVAYLGSGAFGSAVFENWESEFLQMAAYVVLTAYLFQRGSAELRDPDGDDEPPEPRRLHSFVYQYSLGLALGGLFLASFVLHFVGSYRAAVAEELLRGQQPDGLLAYFANPEFWLKSFQNWQSEFLATAALVLLSIVLRFRGSPKVKARRCQPFRHRSLNASRFSREFRTRAPCAPRPWSGSPHRQWPAPSGRLRR